MTVLTPDEARNHLNMHQTKYDDTFLQAYIDAATAWVEERVGPLELKSFTEQVNDGRILMLSHTPIVSITSVTPVMYGPAIAVSSLRPNLTTGVVRVLFSAPQLTNQPYDVAYTAGRAVVPDDLLLAVKEVLRHMFRAQRSGVARTGASQPPPTPGPSAEKLIEQLLAPHLAFGIA